MASDGEGFCVRDAWCSARTVTTVNGAAVITPARTWSGFCPACTDAIAKALDQLPDAYSRLGGEITEKVSSWLPPHSTEPDFGPSLPLRGDLDALAREIAEVLLSWEERVRDVARLAPPEPVRPGGTQRAVRLAADLLGAHLAALLALAPAPATRSVPVDSRKPDQMTFASLSGTDAGEEILSLHHRARKSLGEIRTQPEIFDGVPCKMCDATGTLERAEPPSDPKREAMWSVCSACRHMMSKKDFDAWAKWYSAFAESSAVTCRRCQNAARCGDPLQAARWHAECRWRACACRACGHLAA